MAFADYTGKRSSAGRYELIEELGEGGMGVVWRVLDPRTGGEVAIKIMKDISEYLRPLFQLEELNVSLRLVAKLPVKK
jgi:serine/threonine-protein kinase